MDKYELTLIKTDDKGVEETLMTVCAIHVDDAKAIDAAASANQLHLRVVRVTENRTTILNVGVDRG